MGLLGIGEGDLDWLGSPDENGSSDVPAVHQFMEAGMDVPTGQKTAPPMINTLSSSLRTHCTTLLAL